MKWLILFSALILPGCSSLPVAIQNAPVPDIKYTETIDRIDTYKNYRVRWGGTIIQVDNEENLSRLQILHYPLDRFGRPQTDQETAGRFILETPEFYDPAVYRKNTQITAAGILKGSDSLKIGNKSLTVPVVEIQTIHRWPERTQRDCRCDFGAGFGYGPYPWGFYPYGYYRYRPRFYYPWY
ncbi:MAG: Slp family lipoprotein [Gammaproteobacteria bacterium]|nr:Slp family lipoprotein [Gammaproteobacteria bacterium]